MVENTSPSNVVYMPQEPPPFVRLLAYDLVLHHHYRLIPRTDSRIGILEGDFQLAVGMLSGEDARIILFRYDSPGQTAGSLKDLITRASQWCTSLRSRSGISRTGITIISAATQDSTVTSPEQILPAGCDSTGISLITVDPAFSTAQDMIVNSPIIRARDVKHALGLAAKKTESIPTLAAIGLAEHQVMQSSTAGIPQATSTPVRVMRAVPWLTYTLIASWILIYLGELLYSGHGVETLINFGALSNRNVGYSDWWRFVTSAFVHDNTDILHVGFNALAMFFIGPLVERIYGRAWLFLTFILGAVVGSVAWFLIVPGYTLATPVVYISFGASGGIMGLMGLLVMLGRVQGSFLPQQFISSVRTQAVLWAVFNIAFGFTVTNINNWAHIGGVISGIVIGVIASPLRALGGRGTPKIVVMASIGAAAITVICLGFVAQQLIQGQFS